MFWNIFFMKIYFAGYKYQIIIAYAFVIMLRTLKEQPNDNFTPSNHLSHLFICLGIFEYGFNFAETFVYRIRKPWLRGGIGTDTWESSPAVSMLPRTSAWLLL